MWPCVRQSCHSKEILIRVQARWPANVYMVRASCSPAAPRQLELLLQLELKVPSRAPGNTRAHSWHSRPHQVYCCVITIYRLLQVLGGFVDPGARAQVKKQAAAKTLQSRARRLRPRVKQDSGRAVRRQDHGGGCDPDSHHCVVKSQAALSQKKAMGAHHCRALWRVSRRLTGKHVLGVPGVRIQEAKCRREGRRAPKWDAWGPGAPEFGGVHV